jgi:histone acetyltransferase (RNA polymerase elongator complex component)
MRILPLFIPHQGCPFSCIYCNQFSITHADDNTTIYFSELIKDFCQANFGLEKEIAFFGGTFTALTAAKQAEYLSLALPYLSQLRGIRISTRPDFIDIATLNYLKDNHVSTIELGIQSFSDAVLKASRRGYASEQAIKSCRLIKQSGFDLIIQLMPGLPKDNYETFSGTLQTAINLHPDGIRLYPTIVLKGTVLAQWYTQNKYEPLTLTDALAWLKYAHRKCSEAGIKIIKTGLHSDIKPSEIIAGPHHPALGELVKIEILCDELVQNWQPDRTLLIDSGYLSLFLGHERKLIKLLKEKLLLDKIAVTVNIDKKERGYCFITDKAQYNW